MKLTDYVIDFLVRRNIRHVFGLTGGAVVHLFDSAYKNKNINTIFCHHEQAAALAAVSYARVTNNLGAAMVTTGPGGANAITGVLAAWQDSIPTVFISGQSRIEHVSRGKSLRQLGTQEFDILSIVKPITKYAAMLKNPKNIRCLMEKAVYLAKCGRPGPVWIDIPLNFQWAQINPRRLAAFQTRKETSEAFSSTMAAILKSCPKVYALLREAKRPLFLAGYGIRLAHAERELVQLLDLLKIPFISTWTAADIVATNCPRYIGRLGITGQRGANLAVQNCDLLISVGSHLGIPHTGSILEMFAREAKIIMVDIDSRELEYRKQMIDIPIRSDAKIFLSCMLKYLKHFCNHGIDAWLEKCAHYKKYNEVPASFFRQRSYTNPYVFMDILSNELKGTEVIVVDGGGTNLYISFQSLKIKKEQRLVLSSGICAMGTGLPESVGACLANGKRMTICLSGDGSMQLNIQELQTIVHYGLPIKIFVMNNAGYLAIRHTQSQFLGSKYVGSNRSGGMSLPDFKKIAKAYGMETSQINNNRDITTIVRTVLSKPGPHLCEILVSPKQQLLVQQGFDPRPGGLFSPRPLEDMYPFLDRQEFRDNMIVKPWPSVN
jgi:acetolactate synthase-1/2/3 large subunit